MSGSSEKKKRQAERDKEKADLEANQKTLKEAVEHIHKVEKFVDGVGRQIKKYTDIKTGAILFHGMTRLVITRKIGDQMIPQAEEFEFPLPVSTVEDAFDNLEIYAKKFADDTQKQLMEVQRENQKKILAPGDPEFVAGSNILRGPGRQ